MEVRPPWPLTWWVRTEQVLFNDFSQAHTMPFFFPSRHHCNLSTCLFLCAPSDAKLQSDFPDCRVYIVGIYCINAFRAFLMLCTKGNVGQYERKNWISLSVNSCTVIESAASSAGIIETWWLSYQICEYALIMEVLLYFFNDAVACWTWVSYYLTGKNRTEKIFRNNLPTVCDIICTPKS